MIFTTLGYAANMTEPASVTSWAVTILIVDAEAGFDVWLWDFHDLSKTEADAVHMGSFTPPAEAIFRLSLPIQVIKLQHRGPCVYPCQVADLGGVREIIRDVSGCQGSLT